MVQASKRERSGPGAGEACCSGLGGLLAPKLFKALCDPNRVAILVRLAEACVPRAVSEVAECCTVDLSVVSRHLAQLRDAGILQAERRGKEVLYSVRVGELVRTLRAIADALERCCPLPAEGSGTLSAPPRRTGGAAARGARR